jgi:hypothetical protein
MFEESLKDFEKPTEEQMEDFERELLKNTDAAFAAEFPIHELLREFRSVFVVPPGQWKREANRGADGRLRA